MILADLRKDVLKAAVDMYHMGLTRATGGNISAKEPGAQRIVITPSGVPYEKMVSEDIVVVDLEGQIIEGRLKPSSELPMHLTIYRHRPEAGGVVHSHSVFATVLATLGWSLPCFHYLVPLLGNEIKTAAYATYGTPQLGEEMLKVLGNNKAVLLQQHGALTFGNDVFDALTKTEVLEFLAEVYYRAKSAEDPTILPEKEQTELSRRFASYGQK